MKIAIDAMGGDYAPTEVIKGVELMRNENKNASFILFGDKDQITPLVQNMDNISIVHTTEEISMGEEPVKAIKTKKNSSLVKAAEAVKNGEADALFSAGNTGALLAASIFIIGRIKGITRPGLLTLMPSVSGPHDYWVFMDVGANAEPKAEHIYQYAILGNFYAKNVLHYTNPRVALLNIGTEEDKGDTTLKDAYALINENKDNDNINFIGNIESRDYLQGVSDVVVTGGLAGNFALKATEGTALTILRFMKQNIKNGSILVKLGALFLKPVFKLLANKLDYTKAGGAVIMGVKAPVVKAHGSSKALTIKNSLNQLISINDSKIIAQITDFSAENLL